MTVTELRIVAEIFCQKVPKFLMVKWFDGLFKSSFNHGCKLLDGFHTFTINHQNVAN